jgi:TrmH family RNA methyltransferase
MDIALKKYKKDGGFSYASGVFPTIELLSYHPELALRVFISSKAGMNKGVDKIIELCKRYKVLVEKSDGLVVKLSNSENCYAVGVFKKFNSTLQKEKDHVLLVNPSDMGNLGTVIRTMVGFGFKNLAIITPAVDVFDPKVIRSSTGAFFQMNYQLFKSLEDYQKYVGQRNFYRFVLEGASHINQVKFGGPFTLIFGNEGSGLGAEFARVGIPVFIPHSKDIDSLNLSIAVGIALYHSTIC